MKDNWNEFFEMLIHHEGGFSDDVRDSGNKEDGHGNQGSTMLGVTAYNWAKWTGKPAPKDVMRKLTKEDVKPLYKKNYWDTCSCDDLPSGLDISIADLSVNAGKSRASKILQRILGVFQDGAIGKQTLTAVANFDPQELVEKYYDGREGFYKSLNDYKIYGKGWSRRNKETLEKALKLL